MFLYISVWSQDDVIYLFVFLYKHLLLLQKLDNIMYVLLTVLIDIMARFNNLDF